MRGMSLMPSKWARPNTGVDWAWVFPWIVVGVASPLAVGDEPGTAEPGDAQLSAGAIRCEAPPVSFARRRDLIRCEESHRIHGGFPRRRLCRRGHQSLLRIPRRRVHARRPGPTARLRRHADGSHHLRESFSRLWPGREHPWADRLNAMPKYVFSSK